MQWLRDGLKIIKSASETGNLAENADPAQDVIVVPAFVGLGAPWWDAEAWGAIYRLTRNSGPAEIAKATLEAVAYQTHDLIAAMPKDWMGGAARTVLRVDGGMTASDWTMQRHWSLSLAVFGSFNRSGSSLHSDAHWKWLASGHCAARKGSL